MPRSAHFDPSYGNAATGPGLDATDFILYVTAVNVYCDNAVAYATGCSWALGTNRPLTGMVNWCPPYQSSLTDTDGAMATMMHELVHALVRII